jgi:hypothetical protein
VDDVSFDMRLPGAFAQRGACKFVWSVDIEGERPCIGAVLFRRSLELSTFVEVVDPRRTADGVTGGPGRRVGGLRSDATESRYESQCARAAIRDEVVGAGRGDAQTNLETREAWQATRAAAGRLGIAEGAYLPTLGTIRRGFRPRLTFGRHIPQSLGRSTL